MMNKLLHIICLLLGIGLALWGWKVLPETVVVQIDFLGNASSELPKLGAIIVPAAITLLGTYMGLKDKNDEKRAIFLSLIGVILMIALLWLNR